MKARTLPREIDDLLWAVAESHDPRAVEEFGERYPAYRQELVERLKLVRSLRTARPAREVPSLKLPEAARPRPVGRGLTFVLAGAMMLTLAFATVATVKNLGRKTPSEPAVSGTGPEQDHQVGKGLPRVNSGPDPANNPQIVPPASDGTASPAERTVALHSSHIKLSAALQSVAQQAGLKLQFAPNFEDQVVAADYSGLPAQTVFDDLGQTFGFTVMVEEGNEAWVIPAVDPNKPSTLTPGGRSEPYEGSVERPDTANSSDHNGG